MQCSRELFGYEVVEGRQVVAALDGGEVTTDAAALLLGATDRAIGLVGRFANPVRRWSRPAAGSSTRSRRVAQRVFGIALGYEDLIDHDHLRHLVQVDHRGRWNCHPNCHPTTRDGLMRAGIVTLSEVRKAAELLTKWYVRGRDEIGGGASISRSRVISRTTCCRPAKG